MEEAGNSMELRCVIYRKQELLTEGKMPDGIRRLIKELSDRGIRMAELADFPFGSEGKEALLIAATDETLSLAVKEKIASIGYLNPDYPGEELYAADILAESFEEVNFCFLERVYQRKHHIPWRVIETKRCYLREMTVKDLPDLYEMYGGEGMTDYLEPLHEWEKELEYTRAYIDHMYRYYGYGMWLVKDRRTDMLIGRAGLNHLESDGEYLLEMGYAVAVPFQKMGYATEVCEAVIAYAKGADLGYDFLYCFVREENKASLALLARLGFGFCGRRRREGKEMLLYRISLL